MSENELVCIRTCSSEIEAEIAKMKLDFGNICAFIAKDDCGGMRPYSQAMTGVRLMVRAKEAEAAERLLTQANDDGSCPTSGGTHYALPSCRMGLSQNRSGLPGTFQTP